MSNPRYLRQTILDGVGELGQQKLTDARVCVVGAGGLGCPALQYLVSAGVGHITILDDDLVDITNLGRQILFGDSDVGKPKVEAARDHLLQLNPEVHINAQRERFMASNAAQWVSSHDVILDGSDNFATKFLINDACVFGQKPFSHAGVLRWEGQLLTYIPGGPCYRCLFESAPPADEVPNCSEVGTLGPIAGVIGCLQATEVIKMIIGTDGLLQGALLTFDARQMKTRRVAFRKNPHCPVCGENPSIFELREEGVQQCDLRQPDNDAYLLTFEGHQRVIKAERILRKEGFQVEPKVTPRQLSHECGICLEVQGTQIERMISILAQKDVQPIRQGLRSNFLKVNGSITSTK